MSDFYTDRGFHSREELTQWVQSIGRSLGYIIVTQRSKKNASGVVNKIMFMCDRCGEYTLTATVRSTKTRKVNCKFQLVGKYSIEYDCWTLRVVCDEHTHPPAQHFEAHSFAKRLSDNEERLVEDLTNKNVTPRDILSTIKEQNENNVSTLRTIYNARNKMRMAEQGGRSPMQILMSLLHSNGYVYDHRQFTTCFPLWSGPKAFQQHRAITVANIHENHYVMVKLEGEYPMPPIFVYWNYHKTQNAAGWQNMYMSRLKLYTQLKFGDERVFVDLND